MDIKDFDIEKWSMISYEFILISVIAFVISFGVHRLFSIGRSKLSNQKGSWFLAFVEVANLPFQLLIWGLTFLSCLSLISEFLPFRSELGLINNFRQLTLISTFTWLIMRWKARIEVLILEDYIQKKDQHLQKALVAAVARLASIGIALITLMMILRIFNVSLNALLAFGGAGAVASGLAAKDIVANFFGGLMIFVTRPFSVGDWINSPDKSIEGTVLEIGWYMTCIRSLDRRPIYVPNALFSSLILINPSRMTHRRIKHVIGIRYDDFSKVGEITKQIEDYLKASPEIDNAQPLFVSFDSYGAYSLDIMVYAFTRSTHWKRWRDLQQAILLEIGNIIERNGAEIAFPTRNLYLHNASSDSDTDPLPN